MTALKDKENSLEMQYNDLFAKAKEHYPNIEESTHTIAKINSQSEELQNYLELTTSTPLETASNSAII